MAEDMQNFLLDFIAPSWNSSCNLSGTEGKSCFPLNVIKSLATSTALSPMGPVSFPVSDM